MRKGSILTLGCKANQFESEAMHEDLERLGFCMGPLEPDTELVVVNTCTVTGATDAHSRKLVRRVRRDCPEARIIVTGCSAQMNPEMFASMPGVSHVLGNMEKQNLKNIVQAIKPGQVSGVAYEPIQVGDIAEAALCPDLRIAGFAQHSRAFIQIQTGCNNFCTYCIIPFARGRSRSVAPAQVIAQIHDLVAAGYAEIVLTGIHIGQYGRDLDTGLSLARLVKLILEQTDVRRIRLGSIEPQELEPELIALVAASERLCSHFHVPLQSGSATVLKRMNRHYTPEFFKDKIEAVRQLMPHAGLGLDVITGFPAETNVEYEHTYALLEELPFSYLHVFPYSERAGTCAATMAGQVPNAIRRERATILRELAQDKKRQYMSGFVGSILEVVLQKQPLNTGADTSRTWKGISSEYLEVTCESDEDMGGQLVRIVTHALIDGCLHGSIQPMSY